MHDKLKQMMEDLDLDSNKMASKTGHTPGSMYAMIQSYRKFPKWLKLTIWVWEKMSSKPDKKREKKINTILREIKEHLESKEALHSGSMSIFEIGVLGEIRKLSK